jgi:hypothetical protein
MKKCNAVLRKKCLVVFLIVVLTFGCFAFVGCSSGEQASSQNTPTSNVNSSSPSPTDISGSSNSTAVNWSSSAHIVKDATDNNGYTRRHAVESWIGVRGTDQQMQHPANPSLLIPPIGSNNVVIPFVVSVTDTTKDNSFSRGLHFYSGYLHTSYFSCYISTDGKTWEDANRGDAGGGQIWSQDNTQFGDTISFYGYYVLNNFFSPNYPDGNLEMLRETPTSSLLRVCLAGIDIYPVVSDTGEILFSDVKQ